MKKINIEINQAKLLSYEITLDEDKPEVSATIGLFAGEKRISTFSLRTQNYYSDSIKFEVPFELIMPIKEIAKQLEGVLVRECGRQFLQLEAPKKK